MDRKTMLLSTVRRILQPAEVCAAHGTVKRLGALDSQRTLVIAARSAGQSGALETVETNLKKAGAQVAVWTGASTEPTLEVVRALAARAAEHQPDWIVAVGGGSIIDGAKLAWVLYEMPDCELAAEKPPTIEALRRKARFAAIATTAGSGSEASQAAVLTHPKTGKKIPVVSPQLVPDLAILDATLTTSLPADLSVRSGVDALSHAAEAYASRMATPLVKTLAATAIRSILKYLPQVSQNPKDLETRQRMLDAAYLAGLCQSAASTGLAHALAHAAGQIWGIGHAQAAGFFLPRAMQCNATKCQQLYDQLAGDVGFADHTRLFEALRQWLAELTLAKNLETLSGRRPSPKELAEIVAGAKADVCLRTNPCHPSDDELKAILEEAS
jgi:alcohol dehydrogenase